MDFLVSYTVEDRDWAEWIASHLGSLGYSYRLQDPPTPSDHDPLGAVVGATGRGDDVILVLSGAVIEAIGRSGAPMTGRLAGPGRAVVVQVEQVDAPGDLATLPTARMYEAPDDYATSRDLLLLVVRATRPAPGPREPGAPSLATRRTPLPAPMTVGESFPVPEAAPGFAVAGASPPPAVDQPLAGTGVGVSDTAAHLSRADIEAVPSAPAPSGAETPSAGPATTSGGGDARSAGLLGIDWEARPWEGASAPAADAAATDLQGADRRSGLVPATTETDTDIDAGADEDRRHTAFDPPPAGPTERSLGDAPPEAPPAVPDERLDEMLANLRSLAGLGAATAAVAVTTSGATDATEATDEVAAGAIIDLREGQQPPTVAPATEGPATEAVPTEAATTEAAATEAAATEAPAAETPAAGTSTEATTVHLPHPRTPSLWGRTDELGRLAAGADTSGQPDLATLRAELGTGATAVAVEHAHGQRDAVDLVWWIRAASPATWRADVTALARATGVGDRDDPIAELRAWLADGVHRWLLVFDGVTDWQAVTALVPDTGRGQVVATLSRPEVEARGVIDLASFESTEAVAFLVQRTGRPGRAGAERVVERLGGLPATLELAASFADATGATFDEFLAALDDHTPPPDMTVVRPTDDVTACVLAALRAVGETRPAAAAAVVALAAGTAAHALPNAVIDQMGDGSATLRNLLARYGLIVADERRVAMGAVVRHALAELVPDGPTASALEALADSLAGHLDDAPDEIAPHLAALVLGPGDRLSDAAIRRVALPAAAWARDLGAHAEADAIEDAAGGPGPEPALSMPWSTGAATPLAPSNGTDGPTDQTVSPADGPVPDEDEPAVGDPWFAAVALATTPEWGGLPEEGEAQGEAYPGAAESDDPLDTTAIDPDIAGLTRQLTDLERAVGSENLDVIAVRHQLATAYADIGDHATAATLLAEVLVQCERLLGPEHADTLTARANLAGSFAEGGRYDDAIALQAQVVAEHERLLGPDDILTLTARNNLASYHATAGQHHEALVVQQRVVEDYRRIQGPDHPNTLTAAHNLANSHADLGQHQEALDLRTQVLADRERVLGADHPQTLGARNNLANSHADLGQHQEALDLRTQVLLERERILGPDHPHTLTARNNLANSHAALGRHREALDLRERALADCERILGPDHPHTLTARNNLANSYAVLGDDVRAHQLRSDVAARGVEAHVAQRNGTTTAVADRPSGPATGAAPSRNGSSPAPEPVAPGKKRKRRFWFFG